MPDNSVPIIVLKPLYHRGGEQIALMFEYNGGINNELKTIRGIRFSRTHLCWYLSLTKENFSLLSQKLSGIAKLDTTDLREYLEQRKAMQPLIKGEKPSKARVELMLCHPLNEENRQAFTEFQNLLHLKGYSPNTIKSYCNEFHCMLRLLGAVPAHLLTKAQVHSYLLWLLKKKGYSETHVHTAVNALKFYYEQVLKRGKEFYDLPRPKKPQKLPAVLGEKEVIRLFSCIENTKHQALLMTAYSAGLRVSELVGLKMGDIDAERMMIHIRAGKGKKDRMVPLSKLLLQTLRAYYQLYKPKIYLFEGMGGSSFSTRSAQLVLHKAKKQAGIKKKGSIHSLRHTYATHLLEGGTDIRIIQELLGHQSLSTTMLYTHISKLNIASIQSPLDKLGL